MIALVKGGHLRTGHEAVDVLFDGCNSRELVARRVRRVSTHGTGCTYSAAIVAELARGEPLARSVALAKRFITRAIAQSEQAGVHSILNHFARGRRRAEF